MKHDAAHYEAKATSAQIEAMSLPFDRWRSQFRAARWQRAAQVWATLAAAAATLEAADRSAFMADKLERDWYYRRTGECPECHGTGIYPIGDPAVCLSCEGRGNLRRKATS